MEGAGATESAVETPAGAHAVPWFDWHGMMGNPRKKWSFIFGKTSYKILHMWNFPAGHVRLPEGNVSLHPTH